MEKVDLKLITSEELGAITNRIDKIYSDLKDVLKKAHNPLEERWIDNQDACGLLKVSHRTLQNYRDRGTLPYSTIGGKVFYKASDIEEELINNYNVGRK